MLVDLRKDTDKRCSFIALGQCSPTPKGLYRKQIKVTTYISLNNTHRPGRVRYRIMQNDSGPSPPVAFTSSRAGHCCLTTLGKDPL